MNPSGLYCLALLGLLSLNVLAQDQSESLAQARKLEANGVLLEAISAYESHLDKNPNDGEARLSLVQLLLRINHQDEAIPHIEKLRRQMPNDARIAKILALADKHNKEQIPLIDKEYAARIKRAGEPPQTTLDYARFLMGHGQSERGLEMYQQYLRAKPGDSAVRLELAQHYAWRKQAGASRLELNRLLEQNPNNPDARRLLADLYYWEGDEERAVENYRIVLQKRPNDAHSRRIFNKIINSPGYQERTLTDNARRDPGGPAAYHLAKFYFNNDRIFEADSLVALRLRASPDDADAKELAKQIKERLSKRYEQEITLYKDRLLRNPADTSALLTLARHYLSIPEYEPTLKHLDAYLKRYPYNDRIRLERATVLAWLGNYDSAIREFQDILSRQPDNYEARLRLAEAQLTKGENLEEVDEFFNRQLILKPNELRLRLNYADSQRRLGNYDYARELYAGILAVDSTNKRAREALLVMETDISPIIANLERKLRVEPGDMETRRRLAGFYLDASRFYEAEEQVNTLLGNDPNNSQLLALLKEIRTARENFHNAEIDTLKDSLTAHPENLALRLRLANLYAEYRILPEAVAQYRFIYERQPNNRDVALKLAEFLSYLKEYPEAAKIYQRLADLNPTIFEYRFRAAEIYAWAGANDKALNEYERALRINPKSVECRLAIANLQRWSGNPYAAYDGYKQVITLDPNNKPAQKALRELSGTFLREANLIGRWARDSETFRLSEVYYSAAVNFSLRTQLNGGSGRISFEQKDPTKQYQYAEKGWFLHLRLNHRFDPQNQFFIAGRFYNYAERSPSAVRLEYEHEFSDVPSLKGLTAALYFTSQDALYDLAASHSLETWNRKLTTERFALNGIYYYEPNWTFSGETGLIAVSDGNSRTDFRFDGLYHLSKHIDIGGRYESVQAARADSAYWSPSNYSALGAVVSLNGVSGKLSYFFIGGLGKVLTSNDPQRWLTVRLQYRFSRIVFGEFNYTNSLTTRADGFYRYTGTSVSLSASF